MRLVVVESPSKAKTIKQYLGKDYEVVASYGHIRQLPSKNGSVNVEKDFEMEYEFIDRSKKHIAEIERLAKKADFLLLASDPDREGEAIAEAVYDLVTKKKILSKDKIKRVTYNEITKEKIIEAIENPRDLDFSLIDAQKARLALDYLVGFNLSPVLWRKLPGSKSAGRVQSVALRMIVDRELEIINFVPKEYWSLDADLKTQKKEDELKVKVIQYNKKKISQDFPSSKDEAEKVKKDLEKIAKFKVIDIEVKDVKQNPYAPFITSTLQQDASRKLGFPAKKTMQIAQKLYEGVDLGNGQKGLITYMRTDGFYINEASIKNIRGIIEKEYGDEYLPGKANVYKTKVKNAQEAHEAIRPTDFSLPPKKLSSILDKDSLRLYEMIWQRTIACQMNPAIKTRNSVELEAKDSENIILGRISNTTLKFDGYLRAYGASDESDAVFNSAMSNLSLDQVLDIEKVNTDQHFTSPPPRFNEASLIKELEEFGIGRPSTYSPIITVIQDRGYVVLEKKAFHPTSIGVVVSSFLKKFFEKYVEYNFTADLEVQLDLISDGKLPRVKFLNSFWKSFHENVESSLKIKIEDVMNSLQTELDSVLMKILKTDKCDLCEDGKLRISIGKFGPFLSCSNYPKCKKIIGLDKLFANANIASDDANSSGAEGNFDKSNDQKFDFDGYAVYLRNGKFGPYLERITEEGVKKNFPIPKKGFVPSIENVEFYSSLPKAIGKIGEDDVKVGIGRFGPYVLYKSKFYSVKKVDLQAVTVEVATKIIEGGR